MFSLSVRPIDGTSQQIDVEPQTTLAEIQARLEEQLPPFREVCLVELQVVTLHSPEKALAELERLIQQYDSRRVTGCFDENDSELLQGMLAAAHALGEMQELQPDICERILGLVGHLTGGGLPDIAKVLATIFGRKCVDPSAHTASFDRLFGYPALIDFAMIAGVEIAERDSDAIPTSVREALVGAASEGVRDYDADIYDDEHLACCFRMLALLGDDQSTFLVQHAMRQVSPALFRAAAEALDMLVSRRASKVACADEASPGDRGHGEAGTLQGEDLAGDGVGHGSDGETDPQLDAVLSDSEQEVLLRHQQQLHEAIIRSKAECTSGARPSGSNSSTTPDDRLVLLCFNRKPTTLFDALLASPLAARVMAAGGEPRPAWAGGKLILAAGVTEAMVSEAREAWHVAVRVGDEAELDASLRSIFGRDRPRVKAQEGRVLVPQGTSLFQLSNTSDAGAAQSSGIMGPSTWADVTWRTFIHVPSRASETPRACASAPAEL